MRLLTFRITSIKQCDIVKNRVDYDLLHTSVCVNMGIRSGLSTRNFTIALKIKGGLRLNLEKGGALGSKKFNHENGMIN